MTGTCCDARASRRVRSREQPLHEVDRADRHANAEYQAGKGTLAPALAKGEHQAANDDGNQAQTAGDGSGEGGQSEPKMY